jgi:hypothetical protein
VEGDSVAVWSALPRAVACSWKGLLAVADAKVGFPADLVYRDRDLDAIKVKVKVKAKVKAKVKVKVKVKGCESCGVFRGQRIFSIAFFLGIGLGLGFRAPTFWVPAGK